MLHSERQHCSLLVCNFGLGFLYPLAFFVGHIGQILTQFGQLLLTVYIGVKAVGIGTACGSLHAVFHNFVLVFTLALFGLGHT